nr:MAG TPA: hypothetical protein [Caudoviricetes sp.]
MATINHLKDGTIVEDMSTVTVPKDIAEACMKILMDAKKRRESEVKKDVQL